MQQRGGLENAAQITAASTRAARLAQVTKWLRLFRIMRLWAFYFKHKWALGAGPAGIAVGSLAGMQIRFQPWRLAAPRGAL